MTLRPALPELDGGGNAPGGNSCAPGGPTYTATTSAGTTTLAHDYEDRVTSVFGQGVSDTFSYNGLDTRVGKIDSLGTATYRRDGADVTAPVLGDGGAVYTPGVSQRRLGSTTYDLHDRLGSAVKQTGSSTSVTATRTYDAFGMQVASSGTPQGLFGFVGQEGYQEDGDTGLKLLGHRFYDPSTGRFLTRDKAQDGRNWYIYCDNNPLAESDATGLDPNPPVIPYNWDPIRYPWGPPTTSNPFPGPGNPNPWPPGSGPFDPPHQMPLPSPGDPLPKPNPLPPMPPGLHRNPKGPSVTGSIDWKHWRPKKIIVSIPFGW